MQGCTCWWVQWRGSEQVQQSQSHSWLRALLQPLLPFAMPSSPVDALPQAVLTITLTCVLVKGKLFVCLNPSSQSWMAMGWSKCIGVRDRDGKEIDRAERRDFTHFVVLTWNSTTWATKARVRVCKQWFLRSLPPSESEGVLFRGISWQKELVILTCNLITWVSRTCFGVFRVAWTVCCNQWF